MRIRQPISKMHKIGRLGQTIRLGIVTLIANTLANLEVMFSIWQVFYVKCVVIYESSDHCMLSLHNAPGIRPTRGCRCGSSVPHWTLSHFSTARRRCAANLGSIPVDAVLLNRRQGTSPKTACCHSWLTSAFRLTVTWLNTQRKRWRKKQSAFVYFRLHVDAYV